jgi:hypothetical protein
MVLGTECTVDICRSFGLPIRIAEALTLGKRNGGVVTQKLFTIDRLLPLGERLLRHGKPVINASFFKFEPE